MKSLGNLSLCGQLLLASVLVEMVMLVGNSVCLIQGHLENQAEARVQAIELAYKTAMALPLASRDHATLRDILDGWRKAQDVRYLVATDKDGHILAASGWDEARPLPKPGPGGGDLAHFRFAVVYLNQAHGDPQ